MQGMQAAKAPAKRKKRAQRERKEQEWLVTWFRLKYPKVIIAASANGGARDALQAAHMKREGVLAGMPDLQICKASKGFHGMFIELKATQTATKAPGRITPEQKAMLEALAGEGYHTSVCCGWIEAKDRIDWYLSEDE